ncbi:MAG: SufD family Fe-S cluster assembly protein [Mycoplasmoidaceae bacterium]|nr:SufD family Fe-S cluster assembly protein [Mycoplasmoidaceae bacterium]
MYSNIFLKNISNVENINLKNNQKVNIYFVANEDKNLEKNINIVVNNNNLINIYGLILANGKNKKININIDHKDDKSVSNIHVKTLANNKSNVQINCVSCCNKKTHKNAINQLIDGLLFDSESSIQALPCLDINIDDINAKHTVNIGQVDPEIIFYLNTKGLNNLQAYQFLIKSFINDLSPYLTKNRISINKEINKLIGGKYA